MSDNEHYLTAAFLMKPHKMTGPGADDREYPPSELNIEMAKVQSNLALAYEQRTANLIAWVAAHGEDPSWVTVEIQKRLGLL